MAPSQGTAKSTSSPLGRLYRRLTGRARQASAQAADRNQAAEPKRPGGDKRKRKTAKPKTPAAPVSEGTDAPEIPEAYLARAGANGVALSQPIRIETPRGEVKMVPLGRGTAKRAMRFCTQEPESLSWIDRMAPDSVLWDVGANIGVLTLYAAMRPDMRVVAFEPAAVNYFILCANVELNGLDDRVVCLPFGVGDAPAVASMELSQFAFAHAFSFTGKKRKPYQARQSGVIMPLDGLAELYGLPAPDYLKIDVHGLTTAILEGGRQVLSDPGLKQLQIELRVDEGGSQRDKAALDLITACGLQVAEVHNKPGGGSDVVFGR
ncbi:hypothetical protein AY599_03255 [Leptolyngbya valderiana BDU 20041]|nr:hypothetical protein AY599_03255 [Leptolyngbya valderiana BDU 20041]